MAGKSRIRAKGRRESGRFVMLPHSIIQHPAVATLHPACRWVLVALVAQYDGKNNGALALPMPTARLFGITSSNTLNRSLRELRARGLVIQTHPGSYHPPEVARYAITWKPTDDTQWSNKSAPTSDFKGWNSAA